MMLENIAVIHAFVDGPFDQSSFHFAGIPFLVTNAASMLVADATEAVEKQKASGKGGEHDRGNTSTPHPTVGLVDHVSVLPMYGTHDWVDRQVHWRNNGRDEHGRVVLWVCTSRSDNH
jgi:predicted N-acyltransferase